MPKVSIAVVKGVASVYPFGQQHARTTFKEGQQVTLELGPDAEPKMAEVAGVLGLAFDAMKEDMSAPAAGVAVDEPFGQRDGTLEVSAVDGVVLVRVYAGSAYTEKLVEEGEKILVEVTESNRITLAVYDPEADPKD